VKKCPFCANHIQAEAIKCQYCGEFLQKQDSVSWYFRTSTIILGFLFVGPLVLPLIWLHPKYSSATKIFVSIGVIAVSWGLFSAFRVSMGHLKEYYNLIYGQY